MARKYIVGASIAIVILVIALTVFFGKSTFSGKTGNDSDFIKHLPQLANIDTSKEICFDLKSDAAGHSIIDCFVPDEFSSHIKQVGDVETYKQSLEKSTVLNARPIEDSKKDPFLQFYDLIQPSPFVIGSGTYFTVKKALEKQVRSDKVSAIDFKNYVYLLSLEGRYAEAKTERKILCNRFPTACQKKPIKFVITGKVSTDKWFPVEWARIRVLGDTFSGTTNRSGEYLISFSSFPGQKLRIEAFKPGFSNAVYSLDILSESPEQMYKKDFTLNAPVQFAVIDTIKNTIIGERTSAKGTDFLIDTPWSHYQIPASALIHRDGKVFKGKVTAYFFEFDKHSQNQDLLQNDIFDDVVGYAGNLMKTFGMPYVLFVTDDGERIQVLKDRPMILRSKIIEMEALRTNADHIYSPVTDADIQFLVDQSTKLGGYPIDRKFLIDHNLLRYPVFWVFDQSKGTWINQGSKVISTEWISEIPFYTVSEIAK